MAGSQLPDSPEARYEVARDILCRLIAYAGRQIDAEQERSQPRPDTLDLWRRRQTNWSSRLQALNPRNAAEVEVVLDQEGSILQSLAEGS